jgi:hypothetical protein
MFTVFTHGLLRKGKNKLVYIVNNERLKNQSNQMKKLIVQFAIEKTNLLKF